MAIQYIQKFPSTSKIPVDTGSTAGNPSGGTVSGGAAGIGVVNGALVYSRPSTRTAGSTIGLQVKPRQDVLTTNDVIGAEFSPRMAGVGTGALIALKADPVLSTASAIATVSAVRGIEINIDFPGSGSAYTITNDVSAIRIFPDFGAGHTFSGNRAALRFAAPNTSDWQYLLEAETGTNGWVVVGAGTYSTADGYMLVRVAGSTYRVPFFTAVD
jgi:hypothetical protein